MSHEPDGISGIVPIDHQRSKTYEDVIVPTKLERVIPRYRYLGKNYGCGSH